MIWSKLPPQTTGYFWLRVGGRLGDPQVVWVYRPDRILGEPRVKYIGLPASDALGDGRIDGEECWWAGPIPVPTAGAGDDDRENLRRHGIEYQ